MTPKQRILTRARKAQQQGRAGEAVRLYMLAGELATVKEVERVAAN